jgi:hypothetical protein
VEPFEEHTGTVQFLYWNSLLEMLELFVRNVVEAWNHLRNTWAVADLGFYTRVGQLNIIFLAA